jgi:hypothetical protein
VFNTTIKLTIQNTLNTNIWCLFTCFGPRSPSLGIKNYMKTQRLIYNIQWIIDISVLHLIE